MTEQRRSYPLLSGCGLNCGLCPRFHTEGSSRCPGCGGEGFSAKRPPCGIISCQQRHGGIEFCYLCAEYPCKKYEGAALCDSFITHKNMRQDFERAKAGGLEAYQAELAEKMLILRELLDNYNDGKRKSFFCLAVNLLDLNDLKSVLAQATALIEPEQTLKEKAAMMAELLQVMAAERQIALTLNKKR